MIALLLGKKEVVALFFFDLWLVYSLFALPLGVIGRLCSVIAVIPGHLLCYC